MRMLGGLVVGLLLVATSASAGIIVYSNVTNGGVSGYSPGSAEVQGANTITRLLADDITPLAGYEGWAVSEVSAVIQNGNVEPVTFRALGRFWTESTGGYPETLLYAGAFGTYTLGAGDTLTITLSPAGFLLPSGVLYAGLTFDNAEGTTGATAYDLSNIRAMLYDPPTAGSSFDWFFLSSGAGDFAVDNPAGDFYWFGGSPVANFGWEIQVEDSAIPEPGTGVLLLLGLGAVIRLRRRTRTHS